MNRSRALVPLALLFALGGCNFPGGTPLPADEPPVTLPPFTLPAETAPVETLPSLPSIPQEAILILEPGPGSRLVGTVHVGGLADPTFEQTLGIRILLDDGSELVSTSTTIQAELGNRGPFGIDIPFSIAGERNAFIHVYATSPRDGGLIHLNSVGVVLAESGAVTIAPTSPHPEDIYITMPQLGDMLSGGIAHVEGIGLASFEQTLSVSLVGMDGTVLSTLPVIVNAPDFGIPGTFSVDLPFAVAGEQPGRVVVTDPSVVFAGENHLASVEVNLAP